MCEWRLTDGAVIPLLQSSAYADSVCKGCSTVVRWIADQHLLTLPSQLLQSFESSGLASIWWCGDIWVTTCIITVWLEVTTC